MPNETIETCVIFMNREHLFNSQRFQPAKCVHFFCVYRYLSLVQSVHSFSVSTATGTGTGNLVDWYCSIQNKFYFYAQSNACSHPKRHPIKCMYTRTCLYACVSVNGEVRPDDRHHCPPPTRVCELCHTGKDEVCPIVCISFELTGRPRLLQDGPATHLQVGLPPQALDLGHAFSIGEIAPLGWDGGVWQTRVSCACSRPSLSSLDQGHAYPFFCHAGQRFCGGKRQHHAR